jgi:hypothetical protein
VFGWVVLWLHALIHPALNISGPVELIASHFVCTEKCLDIRWFVGLARPRAGLNMVAKRTVTVRSSETATPIWFRYETLHLNTATECTIPEACWTAVWSTTSVKLLHKFVSRLCDMQFLIISIVQVALSEGQHVWQFFSYLLAYVIAVKYSILYYYLRVFAEPSGHAV